MPKVWVLVRPYSPRWSSFGFLSGFRCLSLPRLVYSVADAQTGTAKQVFVGLSFVGGFPVSVSGCASPAVREVWENVVDGDAISMTTWKEDTLICVGSLLPGAAWPLKNTSMFDWGCLKIVQTSESRILSGLS